MYVPIHTYLQTYTYICAVYTDTQREMSAALQQKVTDMDTQMGALAQMVAHTYTYIQTHAQRKKR